MTTTTHRHEIVAMRVRGHMAEQNHTQRELAAVLGITQTNVSRRYRGLRAYSIDELDVIAKWLNVRVEDFFRLDVEVGERRAPLSRPTFLYMSGARVLRGPWLPLSNTENTHTPNIERAV